MGCVHQKKKKKRKKGEKIGGEYGVRTASGHDRM